MRQSVATRMTRSGGRGIIAGMSASVVFDPFGGPFLEDPYPQFAGFVESQPVFWSDELSYWVVSRYRDVRRVLRDYETFSAVNALAAVTPPCPAAGQALASGGFRSIPTLTNVDPPAHTRTRRIAQLAFSPRRVAQMEEFVRGLVRRFIDDRLHDGRAEIVSALTWELPALVIFDILGVPAEDVAAVKEGAANRLLFMFGRASEAEQVEIATGMASFWRYCEALAEDRRAHPARTSRRTSCTPRTATGSRSPNRRCRRSCSACSWPVTRPRRTSSATPCAGCSSSARAGRRSAPIRR